MFLTALLLSAKNYWTTRGITNYWLFVAVAALLGTGWSGSLILEHVAGVTHPVIHGSRLPLVVTAFIGYTASLVNAAAADVVAEVV